MRQQPRPALHFKQTKKWFQQPLHQHHTHTHTCVCIKWMRRVGWWCLLVVTRHFPYLLFKPTTLSLSLLLDGRVFSGFRGFIFILWCSHLSVTSIEIVMPAPRRLVWVFSPCCGVYTFNPNPSLDVATRWYWRERERIHASDKQEEKRRGRKKHQKSIRLLHDIIGFCTRSTSIPYAGAGASHYFVRLLSLILPCYAVCVCVCVCVAAVQNILKSLSLFDPQRVSVGAQREKPAPRATKWWRKLIGKRRRRRRRQRPRKANAYWMDRIIRDPCFFFFFFFFLTASAVKILFEADEVYSTQFGQMFHFLVGSSGSFEMKKR